MTQPDPSQGNAARIWKSTAAALLVAAILLALVIWPDRRGPETAPAGPVQTPGTEAQPGSAGGDELDAIISGNIRNADPGAHQGYATPFRSEVFRIELASLEEVEFKAHMRPGDTFVYSWNSAEPLYVDAHGEPYTYPQEPAQRYEEQDEISAAHGRLTATFPGMHGWFWLNTSEAPVVIELTVAGFYERFEEVYRSSP